MKEWHHGKYIKTYITKAYLFLLIASTPALAVLSNSESKSNSYEPQNTLQKLDPSISKPKLKKDSCGIPVYPEASKHDGKEGKVGLQLYINTSGDVVDSKIAISSGFTELDNEAVKFLSQCKFYPAQKDGNPIAVWYPIYHKWQLTSEGSDPLNATDNNYTFKSEDNNSYSNAVNRTCSLFTNELINNNWLRSLDTPQKPVDTEVCICVEAKIRKDFILNKLYVEDTNDIKEFMDEEQLKLYTNRKTSSYILSCAAESLDTLSPKYELTKHQKASKKEK